MNFYEKKVKLNDVKCSKCFNLLMKAIIVEGRIEIKCKCGTLNTIESKQPDRQRDKVI
jgi:phage FluMu protein Com